jgi:hypothetical protein
MGYRAAPPCPVHGPKEGSMKVTVYLSDGGQLSVGDFDMDSALDMVAELPNEPFAKFEMDGATVVVNTAHIVRIDID